MNDSALQPTTEKLTRTHWLLLGLIIAASAVLRFIYLGAIEAHFDEIWYLEISTGRGEAHSELPMNALTTQVPDFTSLRGAPPWYAVYTHMSGQPHPPLHPLLLRLWREAFGESLVVARAMSAVLSVLCVLALFDAVRQICPPSTALWAALMLAVSSTQIHQAQENRQYTLLTLMSLCAGAALLRIERAGLRPMRLLALLASTVGALFAHYFSISIVAAIGLYALIRLRGRQRQLTICTLVAACLIFAVAWGPFLAQQRQAFATNSSPGVYGEQNPHHWIDSAVRLATVPLRQLFEPRPSNASVAVCSAAIFFLPFLLLRRQPALLVWILWLLAAVALPAAIDLTAGARLLTSDRHLILAGPAVCALLAILFARERPMAAHGVPAVVVLACIGALGLTYYGENPAFSGLGKSAAAARADSDPFVFYSDAAASFWSRWMFLAVSHYSGAFPRDVVLLDRPAGPDVLAALKQRHSAWVVVGITKATLQQLLPGCQITWVQSEPIVGTVAHVVWIDPGQENAGL